MKELIKKITQMQFVNHRRSLFLSILLSLLTLANAIAADRYWVGGSGNWNSIGSWSTTSGGAPGASVPTAVDNVFINASSGSGTININVNAVCNNFSWTSNALIVNGTAMNTLTINGDMTGGNGLNWTMGGNVTIDGTVSIGNNTVIAFNGNANTFNGNVTILGTTGAAVTINNATFNGLLNNLYQRYIFTGDAIFGVNSVTTFLGGAFAKTFQDLTVKQGASLDFQTLAPAVDQFTNIYLESNTTFKFNEQGLCDPPPGTCTDFSSVVTGKIVVNTTFCTPTTTKLATITSTNGDLSNIKFDTDQDWNNVDISNLFNVGSANIRVKSGIFGIGSNNGIENWVSAGRRVYWIGGTRSSGTQNWDDCLNWATSSGGTVEGSNGIAPPTSGLDTVLFDANSFSATRNQVVINVGAGARNMDWTGATNNPTLSGSAGPLIITGNLVFINAMTVSTTMPVQFNSNLLGNTITMAGHSFGGNIDFTGTGSWTIQDNLSTNNASTIRIQSGTFNSNNRPISAGAFNANSTLARTINLGSSLITLGGVGDVFDLINLDPPNAPFVFNPGSSVVVFDNNNAGNINIETGKQLKTLPNFVFTDFTANSIININTSSEMDAGRITFQSINITTNASPRVNFNITGKTAKTYGAITFANGVYANFDGTTTSTVGNNNIFNGSVTMGIGTQVNFNNSNTFNQNFTVNGTAGTGVTFTGDIAGINNVFNGTVNATGLNSIVAFSNEGNNNFNQNITVGGRVIWSFNSCASCTSTVAMGRSFIVTAGCGDESIINSSGLPTAGQARVNFGLNYMWQNVTAQNLNNIGTLVDIVLGGVASINNIGINVAPGMPRTLYWVGGTGNWNSTTKWSLSSGGMSGECPPRLIDNVIFDNNSGPASFNATIDADGQANNISFNGTTSIPTLMGAADKTLTFAGNFTMAAAGSLVQTASNAMHYQGRVIFTNLNPPPGTPPTIAMRGSVVFRDVAFGTSASTPAGSAWNLDATNGDLTVLNKIELVTGTLNTNGRAVSAGFFDANPKGLPSAVSNLSRTLTLGNTIMTITGAGTTAPDNPALDFRGSNLTVNTPGANARIDMTNTGNIIVYTGTQTGGRTMPRIDFTANVATNNTITVNTGNGTDRITFRELNINANRTNLTFLVTGTSPKTYSTGFNLGSGASNENITVNLDGSSNNAQPNIFDGAVTLGRVGGAGITATIRNANTFNGNVTVNTTTATGIIFSGTGNNNFDTDPSRNFTFAADNATATFSNMGTNTYRNVTLRSGVEWNFNSNSVVNGFFNTQLAFCSNPATIQANVAPANVNFALPHTIATNREWQNSEVGDLNVTGGPVEVVSKTNLGGNSGAITFTIANRTLYWVGGATGSSGNMNWNDTKNWSSSSGGSGGECIPSCSDIVLFDANSFVVGGRNQVNINANSSCGTMDWTGATNNPTMLGTSNLTICGSLKFIPAMNQDGTGATYSGTVRFRGEPSAPVKTIEMAGKSFNNIDFNGAANASEWSIVAGATNAIRAVNSIRLIRGRLNVTDATGDANPDVICSIFDADNSGSNQVRRLDFGASSLIRVQGTGDVLDLSGNTANFTITYSADPTGTSAIELNNAGAINVYVGTESKTIPNLNFSTASTAAITISDNNTTTNPTTNRITFRNINVANNRVFNMNTNAPKTYGDLMGTGIITFGNNTNATFNGTNNSALATVDNTSNIFNSTVTFGTGTRALFNNNNLFNAAVLFGSTTTNANNTQNVYFSRSNTFRSTLTFSNVGPGWATFGQTGTQNIFEGAVAFNGLRNNVTTLGNNTSFARYYSTLYVNSAAPAPDQSTGTFNSQIEYRDNVTWGNAAGGIAVAPVTYNQYVDMHDGIAPSPAGAPAGREFLTGIDSRFTFNATSDFRNMRHGENNLITYNNVTTHDNYFLTRFDIIQYPRNNNNPGGPFSRIRQRMEAFVDCNSWIRISSTLPTEQANIQFDEPHTEPMQPAVGVSPHRRFEYALFQDINKIAGGAHVIALPANTADISNNTDYVMGTQAGIQFINPITRRTFYWVRSVNQINAASATATGDWADELLDNHWSSPDLPVVLNPVTMMNTPNVGGFGGSGLGPSGCIPTPIDSVIFDNNSLANTVVSVDKYSVYSNGQNWANTVPITLQGADVYTIHVYGTFVGSPNTTNNFGGTYFFTGTDTQNGQIEEITSNTQRFFGPVVFNNERDRWVIKDNMNIENDGRGSFTINYGIVDMGGLVNNPTPPTLTLDGNFTMTARVNNSLRVPLFIPRNGTVVFDGKNNDQEIRMDANTTNGQMKTTLGCVECTEYTTDPTTDAHAEITMGLTLNPPANSTHLDSRVISCNRSPFYNITVDKRWDRTLNIQGSNGAIALSIYNNFRILNGRVVDNGNQIRGNVTNPLNMAGNSGVMEMSNNTALIIGSNNTPTVFPTCYRTSSITLAPMPRGNVYINPSVAGNNMAPMNPTGASNMGANNSPEVRYVCRDNRQMVAGSLNRTIGAITDNIGPSNYATLTLAGTVTGTVNNTKDLTGAITIHGALRIMGGNTFRDMGKQITGNNFSNITAPQTFNMIFMNGASSSDRATLELGTGTDVAVSPLTYSNASLPANIARPITTAADPVTANVATTFPYFTNTIGNFVAGVANTGKMNLQTFSTVIFNAGTTQQVLGGFTYGNITLRSPGTTMAPLINKTIVRDMSSPLPFNLDIAGDLRLEEWNNFIDDGWQINGRANKTYTALANSQLTIGINDVGTQFPTAYTNPNIILDATNLTVYNAGHLANMSMLPHQIMSTVPTYGSLTLRDPTAIVGSTDLIEKRFDPPSPVGVKGDITIERHNHLNDNGSQISRLTAGGVLTMEDGWATVMGLDSSQVTRLTLGSATSATTLPLNFTTTLLNDNTTVVYSSGITQLVAGGARLNGMSPNSYFNLWLQSLPAATVATKNLEGAITVRNDLVIRQNISFNDANDDASPTNAFQITGSATGNMTMEANSELRLNKANTATSTVFPTNFIRTNIGLNLSSKVIYNSNVAQDVSSLPLYGSVIMRKFTPIAPLVPKTVTTVRSNLDVRGDSLKIEAYNHLIDNGVQIDGTATGFMFMDYRSQLTLGTPMTATSFPTDFLSERINMDSWLDYPSNMMLRPKTDMSFVIYNSDLPQLISAASPVMGSVGPGKATSFSTLEKSSWYGNVRLSSTAAVTKTLENNVNIRGGLYIDGNNTLEVTTNHYDIYLGGDWEAAANSDFLARQGRVILDGIDRTQNITTDAAPFYEIEIDKPGTNRTAILLDQLTLTHRAVYKAGYFISSPTREFIYDVNANHSTEAGTGTEYGDADARTNGPSSLSHVFGPVTKIGVNNINTFYFPIGNTSVYAPAGIRAPAGTNNATTITARYFGFNLGLMGIDTAPCPSIPLTNISTAEYWTLDAPGGTTAPTGIQVTLSWSAIRSGGVTNSSLLRVAHYYNGGTGLKWYCEGRDAANSPDKASVNPFEGGVVASDNVNITTFSPFTLGSLNPVNPLPIQLIKFEAKAIEEQKVVELRWQTAREINNDFFVLEKSKDGKNFIAFKNVPSKNGNSTVTNDYLEIDQEPISGLSYYRLKQVDNDGTYTYSKIIPVYFADENAEGGMILYPNPTESDINLQIFDIDLSEGYISISDMLGREIHNEFIEGISPEKSLPIRLKQNLASGAYILKFVGKSKSYVKSFIVNK